jgi:hypothetical protein
MKEASTIEHARIDSGAAAPPQRSNVAILLRKCLRCEAPRASRVSLTT